jgi:hypothetical protein
MVKLKPITTESWLVLTSDGTNSKIGLLSEQRDKIILLAGKIKTVFRNREEVVDFFQDDVFVNVLEESNTETGKQFFVRGFPVIHDNPVEAPDVKHTLPIYAKEGSTNILFSAGYYCLNFPKCWRPSYCPKLKTLESYPFEGPFKTKAEMQAVLTKRTRESK